MIAFIDIDTQIDFVFPAGALYAPGAERVIPVVAKLNHLGARYGIPVISTVCAHPENSEEFRVWPPHCVIGTVGQQKPAATLAGQILIPKNELDPFSNPAFEAEAPEECYVYGVLLEYCVQYALTGLLERGRKVWLVTDATAHLLEEAGRTVTDDFVKAGGCLIESGQIPIRLAS